jgi:Zn-dependent protease with chaperone function
MLSFILSTIFIVIITLIFIKSILLLLIFYRYIKYEAFILFENYKLFIIEAPEKLGAVSIFPDIIVFSKEFKEKLNEEEFKAALYHGIGHLREEHNLILIILEFVFVVLSYAIYFSDVSNKFLTLILFLVIFDAIYIIISTILELQADYYACKKGYKDGLLSVLTRLKYLANFGNRFIINFRIKVISALF